MIRVLHVLGGLHAGGMEAMIMNYYRNIDREKIQFDFLVLEQSKCFFDDEVLALGGRIYRVTPRRRNPYKNYSELNEFFKEHKEYEIVHIHQGINYFAPLVKAKKNNVKIRIVHSHGMDPGLIKKQGFLFNLYTRPKIERLGTNFIACSNKAAKQIFTENIIENNKYKILNNAIDIERFSYNKNIEYEVRTRLSLHNKFVVGHVGNFNKVKNHSFLLKVFNEILNFKTNAILVLVGEGKEQDFIKEQAILMGIEDKVLFLGNRKDVNEILTCFDRFVFPSYYEGLPLALIEAQVCGKKCFVSDSITKEVAITSLIKYISLNDSPKKWAEEILSTKEIYPDKNIKNTIQKLGYDIKSNSRWLENYYINLKCEI